MYSATCAVDEAIAEAQKRAALLREWGAEAQAIATERTIKLIRARYQDRLREPLDLETAADESGYSIDHLGRLVREGTIPNAGEPGAPRIRRADVPRKPGFNGTGVATAQTEPVRSATQVVRSVLSNGGQA